MEHVRNILQQIGIEPERVEMVNLSSAMAGEFVAAATQMTERIKTLGKNPLRSDLPGDQHTES